ncbi:phage tail fiber protein [Actinomadura sediminis]|uniref:Head decoration protein n=1 Tax=Actinomadura sediminis TaxID=1038904 RepID=A0ABW3EUS5_9ACTN
MAFTSAVKNAMLDLIDESGGTVPISTISLHTADPGSAGTSEVVGGSYARQSVTWGAAASGVKSNSADLVFNVPAGTTVTHVGGWDGSTFRGGGALTASQAFATAGTYTIGAGDLDATI